MKILSLLLIICCCLKKSKCNIFIDAFRNVLGIMIEGSGLGGSSRSSKISNQIDNDDEYSCKNKNNLLNSQIDNIILGKDSSVFSHTFALLEMNEWNILLEYGQYHRKNDDEEFYHYYYDDKGGARFKQMSYYNFKMKSKGGIVHLNIENKMTLKTLLNEYHIK